MSSIHIAPSQNVDRGILEINIPELGPPIRGKVRENWMITGKDGNYRLMVTTDRQWLYVRPVCTVPGKGQISNLISAFWFEKTKHIIPNHVVTIPHSNVLLARQAVATIPVEVVARRHLAKGSSPTSIYGNYFHRGRRRMYGIDFPDGLEPEQEFPMGTIITPTTKAENGHDEELDHDDARKIVDARFGNGTWTRIEEAAKAIFDMAYEECLRKGLVLADTKFEFGIDRDGQIMLIDECLTPDCSRYWLLEDFKRKKELGLDKEILTRWLEEKGFTGKGAIPVINHSVIDQMSKIHAMTYRMVTGFDPPTTYVDADAIRVASLQCISDLG